MLLGNRKIVRAAVAVASYRAKANANVKANSDLYTKIM